MTDREYIASVIRELRTRSLRTQTDVASYCDVAHVTVGLWETGRAMPGAVSLVRLARLFNVPLDVFDQQK